MSASDPVRLIAEGAEALVSLVGAEPVSWWVGGRELLWGADPAHWARHAPLLYPVVGACLGGALRVDGRAHPMPQHGFARDSRFEVLTQGPSTARFRLTDTPASREAYPFAFSLDVAVTLEPDALDFAFEVHNPGPDPLPYALGVHPGFRWPFDAGDAADHAVVFERPERARVPEVTAAGLLGPETREVALAGRRLALGPETFRDGALVFRQARSSGLAFASPTGASIGLRAANLPHLALWTRPGAPFLSMEAWSGHAEPDGPPRDARERAGLTNLAPGASARHAVRYDHRPSPARENG